MSKKISVDQSWKVEMTNKPNAIDDEYPGHSDIIKDMLVDNGKKLNMYLNREQFEITNIGKCNALWVAYNVFKGKNRAGKVITFREVKALIK